MYKNVPDWLIEKVRELRNSPYQDRDTIYFNAAGWTIAWYLRKNIRDLKSDPFFELPLDDTTTETDHLLWHAHVNRAVLVAESLFLMRNSASFLEQRKRIAERSMRSAFFEL